MKPRNKREKEVMRYGNKLYRKGLTDAQMNWVKEKVVGHKIFVSGLKAWCTRTGEQFIWRGEKQGYTICPECHSKGEIVNSRKRKEFGDSYVQIITVHKGWQVIRYFLVEWRAFLGSRIQIFTREVMQKWCRPGEEMITLGCNLCSFPYYRRIPYSVWCSQLSVKKSDWFTEWMTVKIYPRKIVLPQYKKCGWHGVVEPDAEQLFGVVFSNPFTEKLYKEKNYLQLFTACKRFETVKMYKDSIKVAIRHKFEFKELGNYLDYLRACKELGYDLHNPKYVAPADFYVANVQAQAALDRKLAKEREERERRYELERIEQMERQLEEDKKEAEEYAKRIEKFSGLLITDGKISIKPLMSVEEFAEEAKEMHHCVFSNEYYKEEDSLILSAKIDGHRQETIEVDLTDYTVSQSFGKYNSLTESHNAILELMTSEMPRIKKIVEKARRRSSQSMSVSVVGI